MHTESLDRMKQFIEYFYNASFVPIYYYEMDKCLAHSHPLSSDPFVPPILEKELLKYADRIHIAETTVYSYYGAVPVPKNNGTLIIGPVKPNGYTVQDLEQFAQHYQIAYEQKSAFQRSFEATPPVSLLQMHNMLLELGWQFCPEIKQIDTYHDLDSERVGRGTYSEEKQTEYETARPFTLRDTIETFSHLIRDGNLEALLEISKNGFQGYYGEYSTDLRKNQLVVMIMSITANLSAVFEGGMPDMEAYAIAKYYISRALKARTAAEVDELSMNASLHFTKAMKKYKDEQYHHKSLYACVQYIRANVFTPLKVSDVVAYSGYSDEHFSRQFKKEMGVGAADFILNCKLEEAKTLLEISDFSIGEISSRLYFSNQSHFQRKFKEKYGVTPRQYRLDHQAG